jgi:predicted transcriptional regulator YdeE
MRKLFKLTRYLFVALLACSTVYSNESNETLKKHKKKKPPAPAPVVKQLNYSTERVAQKFLIGIQIRTIQTEIQHSFPQMWNRFISEGIAEKIPNRINGNVLAVYSEYEGDHTRPFSYFLGCEVSTLDSVPPGMIGKIIPESNYAILSPKGAYPLSLVKTWTSVWNSNLNRSFTADFEVYGPEFHSQNNPSLKVYVGIK